jgi:alpha/beta superfamily hydrolase
MINNLLFQILTIIILILFFIVIFIKRFVYFKPKKELLEYPENYVDIYDGKLHGWYIKGSNPYIILICHGNAGNISTCLSKINLLNSLGYHILIFDYTGFGKSEGIPSEYQCFSDASSFLNILLLTNERHDIRIPQFSKSNIIIYGFSLGASIATFIASQYNMLILILDSPLPSIKSYIFSHYTIFKIFSFIFSEFNTVEYIKNFKGFSFLFHSIDDEIILYSSINKLQVYVTESLTITGTHNNKNIPLIELNNFLVKYLPK